MTDFDAKQRVDALAQAWWMCFSLHPLRLVARTHKVSLREVYRAVMAVSSEFDALLKRLAAGDISSAQLQRLAALVDLLPGWIPEDHPPQAQAFRTAAQTQLVPVHLQSGACALLRGKSQSSV